MANNDFFYIPNDLNNGPENKINSTENVTTFYTGVNEHPQPHSETYRNRFCTKCGSRINPDDRF